MRNHSPVPMAGGKLLLCALALALLIPAPLRAQDGSIDTSFQSPLFNLGITLVAVEAGGKVLYGHSPDGTHFAVGRLTSTGAPESSIDIGYGPETITAPINIPGFQMPGATNPAQINVMLPLSNGQVLVGGTFSHFNRNPRRLLARLNNDGSVDTSFNQGDLFEGDSVNVLAPQSDGTLLVGGKFTKVGGVTRNTRVVRLHNNGNLDASFLDSTISFGASVAGISVQPDGKVLIDASYANASFQGTEQLYRLGAGGGLDDTFFQGSGTPVTSAGIRHALMKNGQILMAGGTGLYNGSMVNKALFRLNPNGTLDASYPGVTLGLVNTGGWISRFLPAPDGRTYFNGAFDKVNGQPRQGVARLLADGTLDAAFVPQANVTAAPGAFALQPDGKLLVGAAVVVGTSTKYVISRLNTGGPAPPGPQLGGFTIQPGGTIQLQAGNATGQVMVLGTSDLTTWSILSTNSVSNGTLTFSDPLAASGATMRFYRIWVAP